MVTETRSKSYTPFGEPLGERTSGYGYNGEYYDAATGMINLRARQYEPGMARFAQRDIVKGDISVPMSLNRYLYCQNDPVNYADYDGKRLVSATTTKHSTLLTGKDAEWNALSRAQKQGIVNPAKILAASAAASAKAAEKTIKDVLDGYARFKNGAISPRDEKIIERALRKAQDMQRNGAGQIEINKVLLKACASVGISPAEEAPRVIYKSYWARSSDYFTSRWWQDESKLMEAANMLRLEAAHEGSLYGYALDSRRLVALQALADISRTARYDEKTQTALSRILNIEAYESEPAYMNYTFEQITYLKKRYQAGLVGTKLGFFLGKWQESDICRGAYHTFGVAASNHWL